MEPSDSLQTPTLDTVAPDLLQRITDQGGGYAFSTIITLAAEGDLGAGEAAREMAWEQIHSGPSTSVLPVWRDAYSMACLLVAKVYYARGDVKEAVRVLDLGIGLGGTLLKKDLCDAKRKLVDRVGNGDGECHEFDGGENLENGSEQLAAGCTGSEPIQTWNIV